MPVPRAQLASIRYRVLIPMRQLASRGYDVRLITVDRDVSPDSLKDLDKLDMVVLGKYAGVVGMHEQIVNLCQRQGVAVAYDVCDDLFGHKTLGEEFLRTIREARIVIAASQSLADTIADRSGRIAAIISDPFEGPRGASAWRPCDEPLKLLWFGQWTNYGMLDAIIPDLLALGAKWPLALTIVTIPQMDLAKGCKQFNQRNRHRLSLRHVEWTVDTTWRALAETDVVIIPQQTDHRARMAKSPNRLIESMWGGRFVVANPVPSYLEFGAWAALNESIIDGLEWTLAHQETLVDRITCAQEYILAHYSPQAIADRWEAALLHSAEKTGLNAA